jgi:hypothetical protein
MLCDQGLKDVSPSFLERSQGAGLIQLHETAVANYVGSENGGKPALDAFFGHVLPSRLKAAV